MEIMTKHGRGQFLEHPVQDLKLLQLHTIPYLLLQLIPFTVWWPNVVFYPKE